MIYITYNKIFIIYVWLCNCHIDRYTFKCSPSYFRVYKSLAQWHKIPLKKKEAVHPEYTEGLRIGVNKLKIQPRINTLPYMNYCFTKVQVTLSC